MATKRLELLQQMVAQDGDNSFARYGLAMEYANTGELAAAVAEFRALISRDSNYAAAYYHAGQALEKLGQVEDARAVYKEGMEITGKSGDAHTRAEIEAALNLLPV